MQQSPRQKHTVLLRPESVEGICVEMTAVPHQHGTMADTRVKHLRGFINTDAGPCCSKFLLIL